jgi:hypothetical protein
MKQEVVNKTLPVIAEKRLMLRLVPAGDAVAAA